MEYSNRMMKSESQEESQKPDYGHCSCGEPLRHAEQLHTTSGTHSDVLYCPNPSAHGGEVKFQLRKG